ncbi:bifunctional diguanylate cyclase/phosphodiesterase [Antarcticirhabdus aurantiaca]|uniref:EAL domain-containing protein n=1 Tax=Antarcticirhabdus aurantiaca TaxID=2606717 RepID=A0ACD4NK17_9HYPH|nr:EAL domain-containing protein [Antarcticirhabdus aurantiaca]WAJ27180.1 EAL domain-containing protein [Jeongeuplla avenae]
MAELVTSAVSERERLAALEATRALGIPSSPSLERVCELAREIFGTPISYVSLLDGDTQWIKADNGLPSSMPRASSFCDLTIRGGEVVVVPDAAKDARFRDSPLVAGPQGIRFYAGAPLELEPGVRLGALCLAAPEPRVLTETEARLLKRLAESVIDEVRRHASELDAARARAELDRSARENAEREEDLLRQNLLRERTESFSTSGSWEVDLATGHLTWSDGLYRLIGVEPRCGDPATLFRERVHPDDVGILDEAVASVAMGRGFSCVIRVVDGCGRVRHLSSRAEPLGGPEGAPERMIGVLNDVTQEKAVEAALRESEDHHRHAVELSPQVPWTAGPQGEIMEAGPRWAALTGMREEDTLGSGWVEALHPDDLHATLAAYGTALASGQPLDLAYRIRLTDGSYRWFRAYAAPRRAADGSIVRWYGTLEDIHDRRIAEEALRRSEAFARNILESTTDAVVVLDADWRVRYMNRRAEAFVARTSSLKVGDRLADLYPDHVFGELGRHMRAVTESGQACQVELFAHREKRWVELQICPTDEGGLSIFYRDVTEERRAREETVYLARHDTLTGLANRARFNEALAEMLASGERPDLAVLLFDLDLFKEVNDSLGHPVGDALLRQVAARLGQLVGEDALLARLGGDEFAAILRAGRAAEAAEAGARLVDGLRAPFFVEDNRIELAVSVGIAFAARDDADASPEDLFKAADIALYRAKEDGGDTARLFERSMMEHLEARQSMKRALAAAPARGELDLAFQPIIDLENERVEGVEALLRWQHPERGSVSPAEFIPLAEETGLIAEIGDWVLERACREAAGWPAHVSIAVNVSPVQFRSESLPLKVMKALTDSDLPPGRLELEIVESVLLQDSERNMRILHALKAIGVRISLDDFGTGFSSLSYLRVFPFDKLKIDRSFVSDIGRSPQSEAILRAAGELGRALSMTTTAEGVETREQLDWLRANRWSQAQGYVIGRPMPAAQIRDRLGVRPRDQARGTRQGLRTV